MTGKSLDMVKLAKFDDLFGLNDSIKDTGELKMIALEDLYDFKNHPFKIQTGKKMDELVESIKENGVMNPGIVRIRPQGGYEIIAGHSRKHACELAGIKEFPAYVRNLSDDEAIIAMIDSNIQREKLLPSEKAKSLKMKYEAMKHQGKKGNTLESMEKMLGESGKVIQRYIRLAGIKDELLEMIDNKMLGFTQGVDISFLNDEEQGWVYNTILNQRTKVSIKQSERLKYHSLDGSLDENMTKEILQTNSQIKKRKVILDADSLNKYFKDDCSDDYIINTILSLLDGWMNDSGR